MFRYGRLTQRAVGSSSSEVAHTAHLFRGVPRSGIYTGVLGGYLLKRIADASIGALVRADGSLTGDAVVVGEAGTLASLAVTKPLVRALGVRVDIIGSIYSAYPCSRSARRNRALI